MEYLKKTTRDVKEFFNMRKNKTIILTGCGTSYYLAQAGAFIVADILGVKTMAVPASEVFFFPRVYIGKDTLLIALSRSGVTTEVLKAVEACRRTGGSILAITCRDSSPLVRQADFTLIATNAEDSSVVQTRSFTTMYIMLLGLASIIGNRYDYIEELSMLSLLSEQTLDNSQALVEKLVKDEKIQTFIFLGSGHNYGLACGAMLNLKETALLHTEAYHFLELRHGPFSIVNPATLVIGFLSDLVRDYETAVLQEVMDAGARVLALSRTNIDGVHFCISIPNLGEYTRSIAFFPVLHLLALYKALAKGVDPDAPPHLRRVITL
ncbi:MAG: SIS domain-containing protein [Candidatus Bathyarchaeia archaeon]